MPYLFWYDPFYHGSFKFKAKLGLGLGTVLLTSSYHSDSKNGSCNKLFTNWVLVPYQEIQALGFPNSPRKLGLHEKPWACISWYGPCTQLVNSKYEIEHFLACHWSMHDQKTITWWNHIQDTFQIISQWQKSANRSTQIACIEPLHTLWW